MMYLSELILSSKILSMMDIFFSAD